MLKISAASFMEMIKATEGWEMIEIGFGRKGLILLADPHGTEVRELSFHDGKVLHAQYDAGVETAHGVIELEEGLRWLCGHGN